MDNEVTNDKIIAFIEGSTVRAIFETNEYLARFIMENALKVDVSNLTGQDRVFIGAIYDSETNSFTNMDPTADLSPSQE
jgi:hypothetical protein